MDGLTLLLLGSVIGLLLALSRPQTLVVPPIIAPLAEDRDSGCLGPLALLLFVLFLLGLVLLNGSAL
jgi:hypothetical protein